MHIVSYRRWRMERFIIEEDTVYEIDEECLCRKEEQESLEESEETEQKG